MNGDIENGRFGWVPFSNVIDVHLGEHFDYGNIVAGNGYISKRLRVTFEFSDATLMRFIERIGYLQKSEESMKTKITIRRRIVDTCELSLVMLLMEVAEDRVDLDLCEVNWNVLIKANSKF